MSMQVVRSAEALRVGDYVQVVSERLTPETVQPGEGHARIEHLEHIPAQLFPGTDGSRSRLGEDEVVVVAFCHGVPGPILLNTGDHWLLAETDPARTAWDQAHPTWPTERPRPQFVGARPMVRARHSPTQAPAPDRDDGRRPLGASRRRADVFAKPAPALAVGDYPLLHTRWPEYDRGVDEGYHRIEWTGHLTGAPLAALLDDPNWAGGTAVLVAAHSLPGLLVLPDAPVPVLTWPNPERRRSDEQEVWNSAPCYRIHGATAPEPEQQDPTDLEHRPTPPPGEADLYPTCFPDPHRRALHMHGITALRPVPAAALPWPHFQSKCPHAHRAAALAATYPPGTDSQIARADMFARLGPDDFAACPYHQGDWPAIANAAFAYINAGNDQAAAKRALEHLSPQDQAWARSLIGHRIWWDDGNRLLTNGQHRSCALRASPPCPSTAVTFPMPMRACPRSTPRPMLAAPSRTSGIRTSPRASVPAPGPVSPPEPWYVGLGSDAS
ncbi:hypothetical protein [Kitasatospora herbaricolor]|uniref:hypothetical protein n=1 Tax=Kitasatospora herbaricolor TaxID=68217 RepID=UPI0036DA3930